MRVFLLVFGLFSLVTTYSQKQEDSILLHTPENSHDSLYYELFKKYRQSDPSKALTYAQKCFDRARALKHQMLEVKSANAIGWLQQSSGDFEQAIETHTEALKLAKEYKMEDRVMYSYNNLGIIYDKLDIYDKALDNYFKCLELARKLNVIDVEISTLNNIGVSYGKLKNPTEALNYYSQAHDLEVKNGDDGLNATYVNMGLTYIDLEDLGKAKEVFQKIIKKEEIDPVIKIASLRGLARCYFLGDETQRCIYFAKEARDLAKVKKIRDQESDSYHLIASALLKEKDLVGALDNCEKAIEIAKTLKSHSNLQQSYELESRIYEKTGD
ncbi:MAG TPA: tetratricopeptide repeat protein, partial [Cyclobacteriaceae bacterium]|nr:tetratricopeptide repeat protein [Cyclobacteriaceae bacterium]